MHSNTVNFVTDPKSAAPPKIIVITVWLGNFPPYYDLWLRTVRKNPSVDWLVVSDNISHDSPTNVKHLHCSRDDLIVLINRKCDLEVDADFPPYKLCDFKPLFASMFSEYVVGYDFWAWGDIDVMYGNIRSCICADDFFNYDVIGTGWCDRCSGPLCFFRNTIALNELYKNVDPIQFKGHINVVDEHHITNLVKQSNHSYDFTNKEIDPPFHWIDGEFYDLNGKMEEKVLFHFGGGGGSGRDKLRRENLVPSLANVNISGNFYIDTVLFVRNHSNP